MQKEATEHEAEDKKKREVVDTKNQADQLVYSTERTLREHGDKVSAETRGNIESALNNLRDRLKGDDGEAIKRGMEELGRAAEELGKALYEEAAKKQAAEKGASAKPQQEGEPKEGEARRKKDDDVIDADFEAKP
jgi:molecular chaperone DnaK